MKLKLGKIQERPFDEMLVIDEYTYEICERVYERYENECSQNYIMTREDEEFLKINAELIEYKKGEVEDAYYFEDMIFEEKVHVINSSKKRQPIKEIFGPIIERRFKEAGLYDDEPFEANAIETAQNVSCLSKKNLDYIHEQRRQGKSAVEIAKGIGTEAFKKLVERRAKKGGGDDE